MAENKGYLLAGACSSNPMRHSVEITSMATIITVTAQQAIDGAIHTVTTTNPRNWTWVGSLTSSTGAIGSIHLYVANVCGEVGEGGYTARKVMSIDYNVRKWETKCWDSPLDEFEYNKGDLIIPIVEPSGKSGCKMEYTTSLRLKQF